MTGVQTCALPICFPVTILGGTGNTRTLTVAQFGNAAYYVVTATLGDFSDQVTINSIYDGASGANGQNAVVGYLTNESATVQADSAGTVSSFTGTGGTFKVFDGLTDVTGAAVTYSVVSSTGVTLSISTAGVYTITGMSAGSGNATLRAVYNGVTIDKVYNIAKSIAGATGSSGTAGASARVMYARIAGSTNPVSGTVTVSGDNRPTGAQASAVWGSSFNVTWGAVDPDPASANTLWQADGIYSPSTGNTVWATPYISNLKVGTLSAITANTGNLNVSGQIKASTATRNGTTMTAGQAGAIIQSDGTFSIGRGFITGDGTTNPNGKNITFDGNNLVLNGDVIVTGNLQAESITSTRSFTSQTDTSTTSWVVGGAFATMEMAGVPVSITLPGSNAQQTVLWLMMNLIGGTGIGTARFDFRILRNGVALPYVATEVYISGEVLFNFIWVDPSPASGNNLYELQGRSYATQGFNCTELALVGNIFKR